MFLTKKASSFNFIVAPITLSKSERYERMRNRATARLSKYVTGNVFSVLKQEHAKLKYFKKSKIEKVKSLVLSRLKQKSLANSNYRYMLNNYFSEKQALRIEVSF